MGAHFRYEYCTWDEIEAYFKNNDLVIIPTGSCEQHGCHLPLITDTLVPEHMAVAVAKHEQVLVLPSLPYGNSSNHECFPGTIAIEPGTYKLFVQDIVRSLLRHGARKFLFINGHSGNTAILQQVCDFLRENGAFACIVDWFSVIGQLDARFSLSGHADFVEASAVLVKHPELVKLEKAQPYVKQKISVNIDVTSWDRISFKGINLLTWLKTGDGSPSGNFGTLEGTSIANGKEIFAVMETFLVQLIREMKSIELSKLPPTGDLLPTPSA